MAASSPQSRRARHRDTPMPDPTVTDEQLAAYLQEQLPLSELAEVEKALRENESLRRRAAALALRRDLPYHSVGSIWRAERLSCPERSELGAYLLGTLDAGRADYLSFHLRTLGCRYCAANLADLQASSRAAPPDAARRKRYFESSIGGLRRGDDK
jgi:anti-sigma factor RsiW